MKYYRCECGKREFWGSGMFPKDCDGCEERGTTLADNPEGHKPIAPHSWETKYDENTGAPYLRCKKCFTRKESEETE